MCKNMEYAKYSPFPGPRLISHDAFLSREPLINWYLACNGILTGTTDYSRGYRDLAADSAASSSRAADSESAYRSV